MMEIGVKRSLVVAVRMLKYRYTLTRLSADENETNNSKDEKSLNLYKYCYFFHEFSLPIRDLQVSSRRRNTSKLFYAFNQVSLPLALKLFHSKNRA